MSGRAAERRSPATALAKAALLGALMIGPATALAKAALLGALMIGPATALGAQQEAAGEGVRRGALTYRVYCRSCHGSEGRGDGPVAGDLKRPPPDLSLLADRAGGRFPALEVRRKIDGRDPVASHGPSEMPVWGLTFALRGDGDRLRVEHRLDDLVALLRSLQRPPGAEKKISPNE